MTSTVDLCQENEGFQDEPEEEPNKASNFDLAIAAFFEESFSALDRELEQMRSSYSDCPDRPPVLYDEDCLDDDDDDDDGGNVDRLASELKDIRSPPPEMMIPPSGGHGESNNAHGAFFHDMEEWAVDESTDSACSSNPTKMPFRPIQTYNFNHHNYSPPSGIGSSSPQRPSEEEAVLEMNGRKTSSFIAESTVKTPGDCGEDDPIAPLLLLLDETESSRSNKNGEIIFSEISQSTERGTFARAGGKLAPSAMDATFQTRKKTPVETVPVVPSGAEKTVREKNGRCSSSSSSFEGRLVIGRAPAVIHANVPYETIGKVSAGSIDVASGDTSISRSKEDFQNEVVPMDEEDPRPMLLEGRTTLHPNEKVHRTSDRHDPREFRPDPPRFRRSEEAPYEPFSVNASTCSSESFKIQADDDGYASQLPTPMEYRATLGGENDPLHASLDAAHKFTCGLARPQPSVKCSRTKCAWFICLVILLPSILVPFLILRDRSNRLEDVISFLSENAISEDHHLRLATSPQHKAAKWIANADAARLHPSMSNRFLDRYALAVLYFALGGDASSWRGGLNFLGPGHVCGWGGTFEDGDGYERAHGVTECRRIGDGERVPVGLAMVSQNLRGALPEELRLLTNLETLILRSNAGLEGGIPSCIRPLRKLRELSLEHCSLGGHLPDWLDELTELTTLGLGDNALSGTVPDSIAALTNLQSLGLENNALIADLGLFGSLTDLQHLYLDGNAMGGRLTPSLLGKWDEMKELHLSNNRISGGIPVTLFAHKRLRVVDLHGNQFYGTIPGVNAEANGSLLHLALHDNALNKGIPDSIGKLIALRHLDVSKNDLQGTLPESLQNMFNLQHLFVGGNRFEAGPFPDFLLRMEMLAELSLREIDLTGAVPMDIGLLSNLQYLDLSQNQMTGTIPGTLGKLTNLEYLLMKDNQFSGTLSSDLSQLGSLKYALLEQNELEGNADMLCSDGLIENLEIIVSDCGGPQLKCSCCTACCRSSDAECGSIDFGTSIEFKKEYRHTRAGRGRVGA